MIKRYCINIVGLHIIGGKNIAHPAVSTKYGGFYGLGFIDINGFDVFWRSNFWRTSIGGIMHDSILGCFDFKCCRLQENIIFGKTFKVGKAVIDMHRV
ncbi:hypothetical protein D3C73_1105490 [compost metagenome]